jgi:hypothetical protein
MPIARNPKIFSRKIKKKWVILEPNKEHVRELDEVASLIWEMAKKPITTEEIARKISSVYNQSLETVQNDVDEFVKKYLKEGFLNQVSD